MPVWNRFFRRIFTVTAVIFFVESRHNTCQRKHRRGLQRRLWFSGTVVGVFPELKLFPKYNLNPKIVPHRRRNAIHAGAFVQLHLIFALASATPPS